MLLGICSVIDDRRCQNVVKTSLTHSTVARVPLLCFYHILTSLSVIYYSKRHGIYLLISFAFLKLRRLFLPSRQWGYEKNWAKFSKLLFSSDESSLLYPNPCVTFLFKNRKTDSAKVKDGQKMESMILCSKTRKRTKHALRLTCYAKFLFAQRH